MTIIVIIAFIAFCIYAIILKTRKDPKTERNIYFVSYFISALVEYQSIRNFYDIEKILPQFKEKLDKYMKLYQRNDFQILCKQGMKHYRKTTGLHIPPQLKKMITNPTEIVIDEHALSLHAATYFKGYWDDVLAEYKRKSAYINRLKYLIDYISDNIDKPMIFSYQDVHSMMLNYKKSYETKLKESNETSKIS